MVSCPLLLLISSSCFIRLCHIITLTFSQPRGQGWPDWAMSARHKLVAASLVMMPGRIWCHIKPKEESDDYGNKRGSYGCTTDMVSTDKVDYVALMTRLLSSDQNQRTRNRESKRG
ncbi:hypothetical protein NPIL_11851 [Nephila pilipes]|uniref:Secreted protein n=1 Tax=Nephila pilipes TaxID=299642 RepID=A0A8X6TI13_NEPPI|nr:hypothetical protein NPIL_11851 [Nephila pilipes]